MKTPPTIDDANLILRLYEMRREEKMRQARAWFVTNFKFKTVAEFQQACPPGSGMNAFARQVITYWDMVGSFLNAGILHEELFFQSGRELLLVWERVKPVLPEMRETMKDPYYWGNLETAAMRQIELLKQRSPEAYDAFAARMRG
jgi:hypothetical protein